MSKTITAVCLVGIILSGCASGIQVVNEGGRFAQIMPMGGDHPVVEFETSSNERCLQMGKSTPANSAVKMRCSTTSAANLNGRGDHYNKISEERMNIKSISYESCIALFKFINSDSNEKVTCFKN